MAITVIKAREELRKLFKQWKGYFPDEIEELPQTGSSRKYFRLLYPKGSVIGTYNDDFAENSAFLYLASHLLKAGAHVPEVFIKDEVNGIYLQSDLGEKTLYEYVQDNREKGVHNIIDIYKRVIDQMPMLQVEAARELDFSICYPRNAFDRQSIQWDLNYFKYNFLKLVNQPFDEQKLEDEFGNLTNFLLKAPSNYFLYRDFQSRNIIVEDENVCFVDFQGGRRGALQYDLASLLYESKIGLPEKLQTDLLNYYLDVFSRYDFFNKNEFLRYFPSFCLIRLLQAFGAYGYRGLFEKKSFFVQSINKGLVNLKRLFDSTNLNSQFPYLNELVIALQSIKEHYPVEANKPGLTISITSFSYKKGIPDDWSGNGGGFVFDCRSLPNPGRLEKYRPLTGCDAEVKNYMEQFEETKGFLKGLKILIDQSVTNYLERNFTSLAISFGCTGGQHRSVYMAEYIFQYLKLNFDVKIRLFHREQQIREWHG